MTIKDAPYELADSFIIHHMKSFGEVIENSLRRGKVRGTEIETGTRYIQMVNVRNILPIKAKLNVSQCMTSLLKLKITVSFLAFIASSFRVTEED